LLCGIDEAGRGPLAGPVCAASVILPDNFPVCDLDDSKKLSKASREKLRAIIHLKAKACGVGWASPEEIDELNIHNATLLAMKRAFDNMLYTAEMSSNNISVIVDGLFVPNLSVPCKALVKADMQIPEVMAASIVAKTARDRLMEYYGIFYPEYGYEKHKGYPTKAHREAILRFGVSSIQRLSFRVKSIGELAQKGGHTLTVLGN